MLTVSILASVCACLAACGGGSIPTATKATPPPAAKVDNRVKEGDLTRVTLSPEAEKRLGVELAQLWNAPRLIR